MMLFVVIVQLLITVAGVWMLIAAKPMGSKAPKDARYRFVGGFLVTHYPISFLLGFVLGLVWALRHGGTIPQPAMDDLMMVLLIVQAALIAAYLLIGKLWCDRIRKTSPATPPLAVASAS